MMCAKKIMFYWESNREWFTFVNDEPRLIEKAPELAKESFEEYQRYFSKEAEEERRKFFEQIENDIDEGDD